MPDALRDGLEKRGWSVELFVAGFPGGTAERLRDLASICKLRDLAKLSKSCRSIKKDLAVVLAEQQLPCIAEGSGAVAEDIDVVLIAVGSNDLSQKAISAGILHYLFSLRQVYVQRGLEVLLMSLGGVGPGLAAQFPELEANRACINARLLKEECVLNFDDLVGDFGESLWLDGWHLTNEGSAVYGDRLAAVLASRLGAPRPAPPQSLYREGDVLLASSSSQDVCGRVLGHYVAAGVNHGRLVFKKEVTAQDLLATPVGIQLEEMVRVRATGKVGPVTHTNGHAFKVQGRWYLAEELVRESHDVVIFYWDTRNGPFWAGWWLGPEIAWEHPGFGRHEDVAASAPPAKGWKVPSAGAVQEALQFQVVDASSLSGCVSADTSQTEVLQFGGCQDADYAAFIAGSYHREGMNHGRPVYRKRGADVALDALIFFWDERDGPKWSGWWLAPQIGWEHPGYARHRDRTSKEPPATGWSVPPYGGVDATLEWKRPRLT